MDGIELLETVTKDDKKYYYQVFTESNELAEKTNYKESDYHSSTVMFLGTDLLKCRNDAFKYQSMLKAEGIESGVEFIITKNNEMFAMLVVTNMTVEEIYKNFGAMGIIEINDKEAEIDLLKELGITLN